MLTITLAPSFTDQLPLIFSSQQYLNGWMAAHPVEDTWLFSLTCPLTDLWQTLESVPRFPLSFPIMGWVDSRQNLFYFSGYKEPLLWKHPLFSTEILILPHSIHVCGGLSA